MNTVVVIVICNHYVFVPLTVCVWKPANLIGVDFSSFSKILTRTSFVLGSYISSGRRSSEKRSSIVFCVEQSPFV